MGCRRGSLSTQGDLIVLQRAEAPVRNGGGLIETMFCFERGSWPFALFPKTHRIGSPLCLENPRPEGAEHLLTVDRNFSTSR